MTEPNDEAGLVELYSSHLGGGPAFPATFPQPVAQGMTLRDAAALAALGEVIGSNKTATPERAALIAFDYADAFVAERAKRGAS